MDQALVEQINLHSVKYGNRASTVLLIHKFEIDQFQKQN